MRIGFVAEPYEEKNASGMGYVILELMREFAKQDGKHEFVFYSSKPIDRTLVPGEFTQVLIPKSFLKKLWFFYSFSDAPDVLIYMVPMLPLIVRTTKAIPMCQELASQKIRPQGIREHLFAFVRDQILMRLSFARAKHIIAASEATKADLVQFYGLAPDRIRVIYDGFQSLEVYAPEARPIDPTLSPYFFFVGKVKYRKNVHGIVDAFIRFKKRTAVPVKLVLAGDYGGPYYEKILAALQEAKLEEDVRFLGYAVKGELYSYYKNAVACLFPSLNEGFGMPIVEAMSLGVPVITSNISSMKEVAGDAGLLVDPLNPEEMSVAFERIYSDAHLRQSLIEKGKKRALDFSWPQAGRAYIALAESAV